MQQKSRYILSHCFTLKIRGCSSRGEQRMTYIFTENIIGELVSFAILYGMRNKNSARQETREIRRQKEKFQISVGWEKGKRGCEKTQKDRKQNRKQNLVAVNDHVVVVAVINGILVVVVILVGAGWTGADWVRGEFDVARAFCGLADGRFGLTVLLVILLALPRSVSLLALICRGDPPSHHRSSCCPY